MREESQPTYVRCVLRMASIRVGRAAVWRAARERQCRTCRAQLLRPASLSKASSLSPLQKAEWSLSSLFYLLI